MADERSYEDRLREAARPAGDFPTPRLGVTRLPDEVAQQESVEPANAAIRGRLVEQSHPAEAQEDGGGEATQRATPRKPSSRAKADEDDGK
jgi:hypothetical protein